MPIITLRHVTKAYPVDKNRERINLDSLLPDPHRLWQRSGSDEEPPESTGNLYALDDLSLQIRDGETMAILGPSGCGKSTLLRIIAGLITPDSGEVVYDGVRIQDIPSEDRGIGMVFQNYALYPHMKTHDNIGFFDIVRRHPERIPERIRYIVDVMGIEVEHLLARKPPTLSGGEQQRVAIAHCLARDPKLFLFDEPLSNLDAKLRVDTRVQLKRLLVHYNLTSVYVTHDQQEAVALADRIAIMRAGKIEQVGSYATLYERPINAFVAQFLGNPPMNLILGRINGTAWQGKGITIEPVRPALVDGQRVWLGIRPEDIVLADEGISARVDYVEPLFSERRQLAHLLIGTQPCVASFPLHDTLSADSTIAVQFPLERVYLFDHKTGKRVG
ncbi:MAG TPA: ABC transporter ATP-binding protein [Aggregatilinea sp.]|uniref:ABC transporter ATP-binding protein n=1 Tax=Aggregatilinea sp. TaxID=2806333 RepID=UPI002CEA6C39|nr:ABC transporter ATP-binding protein [Aggregatilinea sp.]HML20166.1 ABC transporter ATP-binding protein [Aggregatilinea sp.]